MLPLGFGIFFLGWLMFCGWLFGTTFIGVMGSMENVTVNMTQSDVFPSLLKAIGFMVVGMFVASFGARPKY